MPHQVIRYLPLFGVLGALALLVLAAAWYPGGYDWNRVTVSALCAATLPSGDTNPVRGLAAGGLLLLCVSQALLFQLISSVAETRAQRKTIQIAGIGAMVYSALTATPMHNLMVTISLAFYITALLAVLRMLYCQRRFLLLFLGLACLAVLLMSAAMYYANVFTTFFGLIQKLSFASCTPWLFAVQFAVRKIPKSDPAALG